MAQKFIYNFGDGKAEGSAGMKDLLGGKGAGLAEMSNLGLPVPPGFTITTDVCTYYYEHSWKYPAGLKEDVGKALERVEKILKMGFGNSQNPLLISVRSGAKVSMPGMMETVLNIGLTEKTIPGLIKKTGNERFVYDAYRRLIQMYADVVMEKANGFEPEEGQGVREKMERSLAILKQKRGYSSDTDLTTTDMKELVVRFKAIVHAVLGIPFPDNPQEQLWGAIGAVFTSWEGKRAISYRQIHDIPGEWGTAVNIQSMVFGNMGDDSATGVAFTRNPATGEKKFFGEYLINAQGEDVVAGIRTPCRLTIEGSKEKASKNHKAGKKTAGHYPPLQEVMPQAFDELVEVYKKLEIHYRDMLDIEFTIQNEKLWMLQTRVGKRTATAAIKIAVDMVKEGLITKEEAILRIDPTSLDQLLHPTIDRKAPVKDLTRGLPASPGAATGRVVFSADDAVTWSESPNDDKKAVILVRNETSPEDIHGMNVAKGILTARGGMTSHAAVVARGMGKCCVAGAGAVMVNYEKRQFKIKDTVIKEGDWITLDGSTGRVILGKVKTEKPSLSKEFEELMSWADRSARLKVRTNADTPKDSVIARNYGAQGIGLCRTEHMFFEGDRINAVREMILAEDETGRRIALNKLLPMQRSDFEGIFEAMDGLPVTIRTLDPPLHEFLPQDDREIAELAAKSGISAETLKVKVHNLHEMNPMLGHRGCRLGIVYPEITEMQVRAIFEAAANVMKRGIKPVPEIMIPLVGHVNELKIQADITRKIADQIMKETNVKISYLVGTMIELPRAALTADQIADVAEFFSYGTNDLTQTTFGFSRDDAGKFLPEYIDKKILRHDPFQVLDRKGVGQLIKIGVKKGRQTRPKLKVGICGEHGGEPSSVEFCHEVKLDYVSCSPFRIPIARLAAAQAALKAK
ncbi:pyruvate, phosphate dikinase [candidate division LCP-89 bacterium B3_LCP]|uniref:Pyruvate, phosphate dikinase n=1 Tax=candidate division LCP-89 bacterium B3_LCP TaxID=2012998 RepID=A0A532UZ44_UNCL8|nr:MAG: pyruvate, phosphate dikinase [candidate division LCP-89 bacterium B3_LCP]